MKKKIIPIIIALVVGGIVLSIILILRNNVSVGEIRDKKYKKINNNLYYEDELIATKGRNNKESILKYYEMISNYMANKFPDIDFFIYNINFYDLDNKIYFNGYQLINMVLIENSNFTLSITDNNINEDVFLGNHYFINRDIDTKNIIDSNEAKQKALDLAKKNSDKMFSKMDSDLYDSKKIEGECYLAYDQENNLCYKVVMNNGSYVSINARNGEVIKTYFFNGMYT